MRDLERAAAMEILVGQHGYSRYILGDLPLNFHPAATSVSDAFALLPFFGPPDVRVFRLFYDGELGTPS
jgi:hypothetical protein